MLLRGERIELALKTLKCDTTVDCGVFTYKLMRGSIQFLLTVI